MLSNIVIISERNSITSRGTLVEKTILRNKSLIDVKKEDGYTALHVAAINNHTEAAQVLIKHVGIY